MACTVIGTNQVMIPAGRTSAEGCLARVARVVVVGAGDSIAIIVVVASISKVCLGTDAPGNESQVGRRALAQHLALAAHACDELRLRLQRLRFHLRAALAVAMAAGILLAGGSREGAAARCRA